MRGITTDGSSTCPVPIAVVLGEAPRQVCTSPVLRQVNRTVLGAVAEAPGS